MKKLLLALTLVSSQVFAHGHHGPISLNSWAGVGALAWNTFELTTHGLELFGYQPIISGGCCSCHTKHIVAAALPAVWIILPIWVDRAYHSFELFTHGLNFFDGGAKLSQNAYNAIKIVLAPQALSASAIAANLIVIAYRINQSRQFMNVVRHEPTNILAGGFSLYQMVDAAGHGFSIWSASQEHEHSSECDHPEAHAIAHEEGLPET